MTIKVDLYQPGHSPIHQLDPRVKLLFVAVSLLVLILLRNVWLMLAALVTVHMLHAVAHTSAQNLGSIWRTMLPISLFMCTLRILFFPEGEPWVEFWIIQITPHAVAEGLVLGGRLLTMAFVVSVWLYTTMQPDLVQGFVKLGAPHEWGLVLALALRYIPTFQTTYTMISDAQQARGLDFSQHKGFKRAKMMLPIFVAMIVTSLRTSTHLAMALEARGYGQRDIQRSTFHDLHLRTSDYAVAIVLLLFLVGFLVIYFGFGIGRLPIALF